MKTIFGMNGACGRMGQRIIQLALDDPELRLGVALESPDHPQIGRDIGEIIGVGKLGLPVRPDLSGEGHIDVIIDFSEASATMSILPVCVQRKIGLVVATTGHSLVQKQEIEQAAHDIAVLQAPNMSLAVNVLMKLVRQTAKMLREKGFDVEILERHHRFKKDAPSGTALQIARHVQEGYGESKIRHGREGLVGERPANEIGIHAIRVGDNVGEHTVIFSTLGETLELTHRAHTRDCYARGAIQAAKFLASCPPGRYTMDDVLGL